MTREQMEAAILGIEIAVQNGGCIDQIIAHGNGRSNRDITLGLDAETSANIWHAIAGALREKIGT